MSPFNNDWTSSLFMAQDNVAIESVCLDFLRSEPTQDHVYGSVDNYLHEAAMAHNPPSETFYDPEGDGIGLNSLGVHEHWNNAEDMMYIGNTTTGEGIELVKLGNYAVAPLSFTLPPGEYEDSVTLKLVTSTPETKIYYTLDGSYPDESTILYADSITLTETTTINARAFRDYYEPSEIITGTYTINNTNVSNQYLEVKPLEVFPILADQVLYIKNIGTASLTQVSIYDMNGRLVLQDQIPHIQGNIDISGLKKGMYIINVLSGNQTTSKRFVKK